MTNPTEPRRPSNPEQAVRFLSDRLRTSLALMHRGDDDLVPLILASLPRGSRLLLASLGALTSDPRDSSEFLLTPIGRELAASCAVAGLSPEVQKALSALEQERARRAASGEDRPDFDGDCVQTGSEDWK
jgi:hypothetical protein